MSRAQIDVLSNSCTSGLEAHTKIKVENSIAVDELARVTDKVQSSKSLVKKTSKEGRSGSDSNWSTVNMNFRKESIENNRVASFK